MRAGPLSSPKIVNLLNTHFVNVWVLLRDLPELQAGAKGAAAAVLATKLRQHYTDSVDILTLTPELEVIEHLPGESLLRSDWLPPTERIPRYLGIAKGLREYSMGRPAGGHGRNHQKNYCRFGSQTPATA